MLVASFHISLTTLVFVFSQTKPSSPSLSTAALLLLLAAQMHQPAQTRHTVSYSHSYYRSSLQRCSLWSSKMTLARPSSLWLQNMWQSWPFWLAFVCLLYLTGAWFSLFLAFGIASLASLAYRTLINRRSVSGGPHSQLLALTAASDSAPTALCSRIRARVCRQAVSPGSAVFITGCSSGIGRATVRRLLDEGWLVFASVRRQTDADSLRTELRDHPMLHTLLVDVSDERQVEAAAAEVQSKLQERTSRLCAVVCNAGYAGHSLTHSLVHACT